MSSNPYQPPQCTNVPGEEDAHRNLVARFDLRRGALRECVWMHTRGWRESATMAARSLACVAASTAAAALICWWLRFSPPHPLHNAILPFIFSMPVWIAAILIMDSRWTTRRLRQLQADSIFARDGEHVVQVTGSEIRISNSAGRAVLTRDDIKRIERYPGMVLVHIFGQVVLPIPWNAKFEGDTFKTFSTCLASRFGRPFSWFRW